MVIAGLFFVLLAVIAYELRQLNGWLRDVNLTVEVARERATEDDSDPEPDPGEDVIEQPPPRRLRVVSSKH